MRLRCGIHEGARKLTAQPEPLQNLSNLVKAQLIYHSTAAETLSVSEPSCSRLTFGREA